MEFLHRKQEDPRRTHPFLYPEVSRDEYLAALVVHVLDSIGNSVARVGKRRVIGSAVAALLVVATAGPVVQAAGNLLEGTLRGVNHIVTLPMEKANQDNLTDWSVAALEKLRTRSLQEGESFNPNLSITNGGDPSVKQVSVRAFSGTITPKGFEVEILGTLPVVGGKITNAMTVWANQPGSPLAGKWVIFRCTDAENVSWNPEVEGIDNRACSLYSLYTQAPTQDGSNPIPQPTAPSGNATPGK